MGGKRFLEVPYIEYAKGLSVKYDIDAFERVIS